MLVIEFRFDALLCSNLGNKNSDTSHYKCSRRPHLAHGLRFHTTGL